MVILRGGRFAVSQKNTKKHSCSSSNNYIKRTKHIFRHLSSAPLLRLIRKYYVDNDTPHENVNIHDNKKGWQPGEVMNMFSFPPARYVGFMLLQLRLSKTHTRREI